MADHGWLSIAMEELFREDGLCVMARGCGIHKLLAKFVQYYSYGTPETHLSQEESKKLVFVLNLAGQEQVILDHLLADGIPPHRLPRIITSENVTAQERSDLFARGGCFIITSRLLIVDLLDHKVSVESILGMLVANAHRVTENSLETFILRVYRERHTAGFIKAFSEDPEGLTGSFAKVDRTMKMLWLKKLYLWPRFHEAIVRPLDSSQPEVIEILQPLSDSMKTTQSALLVALSTTINELRRAAPTLETGYMTLENGLFSSFDHIVRSQLEPEWHRLSPRTKQLVSDLRSLRGLLDYLIRYDSLTFYYHLLRLQADSLARDSFSPSLWLSSDAAEVVFSTSRERVFRIVSRPTLSAPAKMEGSQSLAAAHLAAQIDLATVMKPAMECPPKWNLLINTVLKEVKEAYLSRKRELQEFKARSGMKQKPLPTSAAPNEDISQVRGAYLADSNTKETEDDEDAYEEPLNGRVLLLFKDEDTLIRVRDCLVHGPQHILDERYRWFIGQSAAEILGRMQSGNRSASNSDKSRPRGAHEEVSGAPNCPPYGKHSSTSEGMPPLDLFSQLPGVTRTQLDALSVENRMMLVEHAALMLEHGAEGMKPAMKGNANHSLKLGKRKAAYPAQMAAPIRKAIKVHASASIVRHDDGHDSDGSADSDALCGHSISEELHLQLLTHQQAHDRADLLGDVDPFAVILYDPDVALVRQLEVFQAQKQQQYDDRRQQWRLSGRPGQTYPLQQRTKVYFLMYNTSVEEHRYVGALAREKKAFESLVVSKGKMAVCLPDLPQDLLALRAADHTYSVDSRTVNRGVHAAAGNVKQKRIVVDVREFRCPLPSMLHATGVALTARSITVGDYVLAPEICVERKSVSDLIGSLQSGRLYNQAESMCRYYNHPCLLIEFSEQQNFSFHSSDELTDDIRTDAIQTRLATLALAFPSLRFLWARSPHCTPDIFRSVMAGHEPVDETKALVVGSAGAADGTVGVGGTGVNIDEQEARTASYEMLLALPGINTHNIRAVLEEVESLADLACRTELNLAGIIGVANAKALFAFLHQKKVY